jgi:uncharacterized protein YjbI with pentapeptide repeats
MTTCTIENIIKNNSPGFKREIKCLFPSLSSDPEGLCILHSQRLDKNRREFYATIQKKIDQKDFDFKFVLFPGYISFEDQVFEGNADFCDSIFLSQADFTKSKFNSVADFMGAKFYGSAYFDQVEFNSGSNFSFTQFLSAASFLGTIFANWSSFEGAVFEKYAMFAGSEFGGESMFSGIDLPFIANFQDIILANNGDLQFEDSDLGNVIFSRTDLRLVRFHNVKWRNYHRRQIIYDEISFLKGYGIREKMIFYPEIERLYRYLKLNYEKEGDLKQAGDFHYGEMDMYRKSNIYRRFFSLYTFYWALSGYGERPSWALGWLAGFLLALPLLVWGVGLDSIAGGTTSGFLETFTYIFEKATFQRPLPLSDLNHLGRFISNLSLLIIPGQAALFLLALRNRLGRRR